jgi:imidazolonepropionase
VTAASRTPATLVIRHCRELISCAGPAPRRGAQQGDLDSVADGAIAVAGERILFVGPSSDLEAAVPLAPEARVVDAPGLSLVPGFVDAHTHAVFAGHRLDELRRRLAGATYGEIAASGGGILSTVRATRSATAAELVALSKPRFDEMLANGTTTCEVKSGYGLTAASELTMLRAIREIDASHPIDLVPTFMGAHEVPPEFRNAREEYVRSIVEGMIPAVASEKLARWCDVFCENGVFTPEESTRILEAGLSAGMSARIHADELGPSGGSEVAARVGARSADHLVHVSDAGMDALEAGNVTATLLPSAAFYLKLGRFAPARRLIDRSIPVALATDVNPGGGFSPSMPFAMTVACFAMDMTFEEALVSATINGAWSLDIADSVGSLEPGKLADVVLVRGEAINLIRVGASSVAAVLKRGAVVTGTLEPPNP